MTYFLCSVLGARLDLGEIGAHGRPEGTNDLANRDRARLAVLDLDLDQDRVDHAALTFVPLGHGQQPFGLGGLLDYRTSANRRFPALAGPQKNDDPVAE